jgi:hypothetical protein
LSGEPKIPINLKKRKFKPAPYMIKFRTLLTIALSLLAGAAVTLTAAAQGGPAITLHAPDSPSKTPDAEGFLPRWLILEPINVGNQQPESATKAAVKVEYFPNQMTVIPHDGDKVTVKGKELTWHAVDTLYYNVDLRHFARDNHTTSDNALFWAVTIVNCPEQMSGVRLAIGSNASSVWWVNGQEVCGIYGDRPTIIDDGVSKRITLKKGPNIVRCAVINARGASDFCARFLDAEDKPIKKLTLTLSDSTH